MFLLLSNSDGLGDPKSLYPPEFILAIPPLHVNRHIAQIPQFFLAIVPKHSKKAPGSGVLLGAKMHLYLAMHPISDFFRDLHCDSSIIVAALLDGTSTPVSYTHLTLPTICSV